RTRRGAHRRARMTAACGGCAAFCLGLAHCRAGARDQRGQRDGADAKRHRHDTLATRAATQRPQAHGLNGWRGSHLYELNVSVLRVRIAALLTRTSVNAPTPNNARARRRVHVTKKSGRRWRRPTFTSMLARLLA
ncbi:MAG TPA: hypothetical protein VIH40_08780, partial [Xanthobacteraceae bacterium]